MPLTAYSALYHKCLLFNIPISLSKRLDCSPFRSVHCSTEVSSKLQFRNFLNAPFRLILLSSLAGLSGLFIKAIASNAKLSYDSRAAEV